jgi:hypothetical protein
MKARIFLGTEIGEKQAAIAEIKKQLSEQGSPPEQTVYYAGETPVSDMVSALRNGSLFAENRLFLVKNAEAIKKKVAKYYNIKVSDLDSQNRSRKYSFPRQIAMYLCREMTDLSLPLTGNVFGGRDHTTVLHAYDKIDTLVKSDENMEYIITELKDLIMNV